MTRMTAEWLGLPYHAPDTGLDDYTAGYRAAREGDVCLSGTSEEWREGWFDWHDYQERKVRTCTAVTVR